MACFVVPLTQAIVTTMTRRQIEKNTNLNDAQHEWQRQLPKLELMLWGGSAMLIVDHILNGELTWMFPFFTALGQEGGALEMLREMLTIGVPMSVVNTAIWACTFAFKKQKA